MRRHAVLLAVFAALLIGACSSGSGSKKPSSSATTEAPTSSIPPAAQPATGGAPWPAPPNPMDLASQAGLTPESAESLQYHVHAHLDVFVNGKAQLVPGGIGIDATNPAVISGQVDGGLGYGLKRVCDTPCISPLHTHGPDGILHTESRTPTPNRLGQFFTEWGVKFDATCVGGYCQPDTSVLIFVDGERFTGDPTMIELSNNKEIAVVIGSPPARIPSKVPF